MRGGLAVLLFVSWVSGGFAGGAGEQERRLREFVERELRADPSLAVLVELEEKALQQSRGGQATGGANLQSFRGGAQSTHSLIEIARAKSRTCLRVASHLAASAEPYNGCPSHPTTVNTAQHLDGYLRIWLKGESKT